MIQIQSSYRIIKGENIDSDLGLSLVETKVDFPQGNVYIEEALEQDIESEFEEEEEAQDIDIDRLKEKIRNQLYLEIENERKSIISKAKEQGDTIKKKSEQDGYKEGIKKGFLEGYNKGKEEAQEDCQGIKENAINILKQAEDHVSEYLEENRNRIINLAGDMAESIVNKTIDKSSDNILMLIKPIIQQYRRKDQIIITSHPNKVQFLKANLNRLKETNEDTKFVILEDSSHEENDCTIENENQIIDLDIRKQIDNIIEEINSLE